MGNQKTYSNGQIILVATFFLTGGGKVNGCFARLKANATVAKGRIDSFFGFLNCFFSKPNHLPTWNARRDIDLHFEQGCLKTQNSGRENGSQHLMVCFAK